MFVWVVVNLPKMSGANVRLDQEGCRVNGAATLPRALEQRSVTLDGGAGMEMEEQNQH